MSAYERIHPATKEPPQQANARRLAARRLEAALVEHARVEDAYGRSIGTSVEQSAYHRLQTASSRVADCDRLARSF
jgi:hypothetical protein